MAESSNGNSTSLGMSGVTIKQYSTAGANVAAKVAARYNYQQQILKGGELALLKKLLYAHVKAWLPETKASILREHGFQYSGGDLDALVVECLIIYMKEEELLDILKNLKNEQRVIKQEYNRAEAAANQARRNAFRASSFEDTYQAYRSARAAKEGKYIDVGKFINKRDPEFKGIKVFRKRYKMLIKELKNLFKALYNNIDILTIASAMGIGVRETDKRNDIEEQIIDKIVLYVDLVTGKNRLYEMAGAITDPEPYNNILKYTSFAFVTGSPGISIRELLDLKEKAAEARNMANAAKVRMKKPGFFTKVFGKKYRKEFSYLSGRTGSAKAWDLETNDTGILKGYSYEQLVEMATKFNIDIGDPRKTSIGNLKLLLYQRLAVVKKRLTVLQKKIEKARKNNDIEKVRDLQGEYDALVSLTNESGASSQQRSSSIPIVSFNKEGNIVSDIREAVPVIIVGQHGPLRLKDKDLVNDMFSNGVDSLSQLDSTEKKKQIQENDKFFKKVGGFKGFSARFKSSLAGVFSLPFFKRKNELKTQEESKRRIIAELINDPSVSDDVLVSLTGSNRAELRDALGLNKKTIESALNPFSMTAAAPSVTVNVPSDKKIEWKENEFLRNGPDHRKKLARQYIKQNKLKKDVDYRINGSGEYEFKDPVTGLFESKRKSRFKNVLYQNAETGEFKKAEGVDYAFSEIRTFEVSKARLSNSARAMQLDEFATNKVFPVYVVNHAVSTDFRKGLYDAASALSSIPILGAALSPLAMLFPDNKFARGGKVKAKNKVSSFISGDSLNGKPNEERVDIDWQKKSFKVTPIPKATNSLHKYATGGKETSLGKVSSLTESEKNAPLSVSLAESILNNTTTIGNTKVSFGELLFAISTKLDSLQTLLQTGNEQRAVNTQTTAAVGSSIGSLISTVSSINETIASTSNNDNFSELSPILRGE